MTRHPQIGFLMSALFMFGWIGYAADQGSDSTQQRIEREVHRELVTLPFYSLFDIFSYHVEGRNVTLVGKVTRPSLKSDAENVVKRIEGVEQVVNRIEVLPLSPNDDRLRTRLYRAIYGHSALQTLSVRAVPPIHIIVQNGNVTLEGMVASEMQKNIAGMQARGVSGVFSVTNNLQTESGK